VKAKAVAGEQMEKGGQSSQSFFDPRPSSVGAPHSSVHPSSTVQGTDVQKRMKRNEMKLIQRFTVQI